MAKTKRDLLLAIAARIGGERGKRMHDAVKNSAFPELLARTMTEEEFVEQLGRAEDDLPKVLASFEELGPEDPGTWGFPN